MTWHGGDYIIGLMNKSKGYTLIEIVTVIGIIGILVAIGAVSYRAVLNNNVNTSIDNDLNNTAAQIKLERSMTGVYYIDDSTLKVSEGNTVTFDGDCVQVINTKTGTIKHITPNGSAKIETGACPELPV